MQCPNDQTTLAMTDRNGIEIDYCPTCQGVWLDKGELDKLISSSENYSIPPQPQNYSAPTHRREDRRYDERPNDYNSSYNGHKGRKKESFLGELFDF